MDNWDKAFTKAQSLLPVIQKNSKATSTAIKYDIKLKDEFILLINKLLEDLQVANWPIAEMEKRWKLIEPLLVEVDQISQNANIKSKLGISNKEKVMIPKNDDLIKENTLNKSGDEEAILHHQQELIKVQDDSLGYLSTEIQKLKSISKEINKEAVLHNQIIKEITEETILMSKKTNESISKAKKL